MGLALSVGILAEMKELGEEEGYRRRREEIEALQAFLDDSGFETWDEPEDSSELDTHADLLSFPVSFLHFLRRAYARVRQDPHAALQPVESEFLSDEDEDIMNAVSRWGDSHLLCHSDHSGYYVPIQFDEPLFAPEGADVPGYGMVGSSYGLMEELRVIAPHIEVEVDEDGNLPESEVERINGINDTSNHQFGAEQTAFLTLWEAARVSIAQRAAICFH